MRFKSSAMKRTARQMRQQCGCDESCQINVEADLLQSDLDRSHIGLVVKCAFFHDLPSPFIVHAPVIIGDLGLLSTFSLQACFGVGFFFG